MQSSQFVSSIPLHFDSPDRSADPVHASTIADCFEEHVLLHIGGGSGGGRESRSVRPGHLA